MKSHLQRVECFISKSSNNEAKDNNKRIPLIYASDSDQTDIVKDLIKEDLYSNMYIRILNEIFK